MGSLATAKRWPSPAVTETWSGLPWRQAQRSRPSETRKLSVERCSPRSAMARTSATDSASAVRTSARVARPRPARRSSRDRKSWKQRSLSVCPAKALAARRRDGGEQGLPHGARPLVAGHRAVVGEDPAPLDERVGVLDRDTPHAGVAHVREHDAGAGASCRPGRSPRRRGPPSPPGGPGGRARRTRRCPIRADGGGTGCAARSRRCRAVRRPSGGSRRAVRRGGTSLGDCSAAAQPAQSAVSPAVGCPAASCTTRPPFTTQRT